MGYFQAVCDRGGPMSTVVIRDNPDRETPMSFARATTGPVLLPTSALIWLAVHCEDYGFRAMSVTVRHPSGRLADNLGNDVEDSVLGAIRHGAVDEALRSMYSVGESLYVSWLELTHLTSNTRLGVNRHGVVRTPGDLSTRTRSDLTALLQGWAGRESSSLSAR